MSTAIFPDVPPGPRPLSAPQADEPARFTARTVEGLEWVLARELEAIGARDLRIGRRTIEFSAEPGSERETLYRAVLESRVAIRVLEPLGRFRVDSPETLYRAMQEIDWTEQLRVSDTLRVDAAIHDTFLTHSLYAAQIIKDAVVDQLRTPSGRRPSVQLRGATLRLALHLVGDVATIFRDAAGRSLHQRGWRMGEVEAPLSEVLAAGMLATLVLTVEPTGLAHPTPDTLLGYTYTPAAVAVIAVSAVLGLLVSLSTFLVIGATSSLTYNVVGHVKTVIILAGGCVFFGDEMPAKKLGGIAVAMSGIVWYSQLKLAESAAVSGSGLPTTTKPGSPRSVQMARSASAAALAAGGKPAVA